MVKWQGAAQECIDDAAQTPKVALQRVWLLLQNFRRHVAKGTEWLVSLLLGADHLREPKVDELGDRLLGGVAHHHILELEIAVDDAVAVEVLDSERQLVTYLAHAGFTEVEVTRGKIIKKIRARHILEDDEVVVHALEKINQVDDVRVLTHLQDFDFSALLEDLDVRHVLFLHLFNGDLLPRLFVDTELDQPELSFT